MEVNIAHGDGLNVLSLSGDVDLHESPEARKQILICVESEKDLLVDLSAVTYIDSSGIASLVEGLQLSKGKQRRFGLVGVSHAAMQVLQLARLDMVFSIYDSIESYKSTAQ